MVSIELLVGSALVLNIVFDNRFVTILSHGIDVIPTGPQIPSPQHFFDFRVMAEEFFGCQAFDNLYHFGWQEGWDALGEEVNMIFISANFDKVYFIALRDGETGGFQGFFTRLV